MFINRINQGNDGDIVIATAFDGIMLVRQDGKLKYQLKAIDGLPNNNVICTFIDREKNLWLGLDNGISIVNTSSPFTRVLPDGSQDGPGYDVKVFQDKVYFATSSGLFFTDWSGEANLGAFKKVKNSDGQAWGLDVVNGQLVLSNFGGAFLVENDQANSIDNTGSWLFRSYNKNPDLIYSGHYRGISFFNDKTFEKLQSVRGLQEPSRFIEEDQNGDLWMSHPYLGVYRVENPDLPHAQQVTHLGAAEGLPSDLHNHVFKVYDQIVVAAEQGVYTYDAEHCVFEIHPVLTEYLGPDIKVRRLIEAANGDVWFITSKEVGVLKVIKKGLKNNAIEKITFPALNNMMNNGWEKIYSIDENHVFITTVNGFLHFDGSTEHKTDFDVLLRNIRVNGSRVIHMNGSSGPANDEVRFSFAPNQNTLGFELAATAYFSSEFVYFQYYLEGYDSNWTPFTKLRFKEYINLPFGDYTLHIRARRQSGELSAIKTIGIYIETPWYLTGVAMTMYILLGCIFIAVLYYRTNVRFVELEQKVDETIEKSKEEIERLETEKIQAELEHKKRELVSATMHLMKKNETMMDLANKLASLKEQAREDSIKSELRKLIWVLRQEGDEDDNWDQIMYHFNELNKGFFGKLKQKYPALTPKDLRLSRPICK
ncbi:MAG: triple tyrosine motif-containing protein [Bacteroidia bacterium]